jgi:hypothetical protein
MMVNPVRVAAHLENHRYTACLLPETSNGFAFDVAIPNPLDTDVQVSISHR